MTKSPRTRTPSADMEAALLNSATEILETEGPDGLSVRRIAAAAGVAPMGVYNHFESKFGIIEALWVQGFERLARRHGLHRRHPRSVRGPAGGGRRYRALALANPMVYQIMFLRPVPGFEPSEQVIDVAAQAFGALVTAVERAMAAGVIAEGVPADTAHIIWSNVHGWVSLELMGMGTLEEQDAVYDQACSAVLRGLRP